ncbi:hypothetical protein RUM44_003247 [Polyplax serrata]|uniref:Band 7 domain-containing protein n=1 Tax=Polyplax serrata TaxID=468196 RepID=A0ABR1AZG8_POLSC
MGQVHVTNPRYVLVVSGGCCSPKKKSFVVGGWAFVCPCISNVQKISLELMTLQPYCEDVETALGVPLTVTATAQCKIIKDKELLKIACEQFLGYDINEIEFAVRSTLEGHLRSILGTLTVEEVYRDRDKFASFVREVAAPDVGRMGIEIISFTIRDISDKVGYLNALGKAQTAVVKRDANIGVAIANRDAGMKEAEAEREAKDFKYTTDAKIGENVNAYKVRVSGFEKEVQTVEAEVALAYELQSSILAQEIKEADIGVRIMERKKLTEIERHEVSRKEVELKGSIRLPAEAEAYHLRLLSEAAKSKKLGEAVGEAERIKLIGSAEAFQVRRIGEAEAVGMTLKAHAFQKFNGAAKLDLIFKYLPQIASEIAVPLSKINEILYLGQSDDVLDGMNRFLGKVPPSLRTIVSVDILNVLRSRLNEENNPEAYTDDKWKLLAPQNA